MNNTYNLNANSGYLLLRAAQQYRLEIAKVLQPYNITPTQFFILMSIWYQAQHTAPPTQVLVAEHAAIDINVTSQVVRKLLARGLIQRSVKPDDSRAYVLTLTPAGETLAKTTGKRAEEFHVTFFQTTHPQTLNNQLLQLINHE